MTVEQIIGIGRSVTPDRLGERRLALDHTIQQPTGHVTLAYEVR